MRSSTDSSEQELLLTDDLFATGANALRWAAWRHMSYVGLDDEHLDIAFQVCYGKSVDGVTGDYKVNDKWSKYLARQ